MCPQKSFCTLHTNIFDRLPGRPEADREEHYGNDHENDYDDNVGFDSDKQENDTENWWDRLFGDLI